MHKYSTQIFWHLTYFYSACALVHHNYTERRQLKLEITVLMTAPAQIRMQVSDLVEKNNFKYSQSLKLIMRYCSVHANETLN